MSPNLLAPPLIFKLEEGLLQAEILNRRTSAAYDRHLEGAAKRELERINSKTLNNGYETASAGLKGKLSRNGEQLEVEVAARQR